MTPESSIPAFLSAVRLAPNTLSTYERALDGVQSYLGCKGLALEDIRHEHLQAYLDRMAKGGAKPSTVSVYRSAFRKYWTWLSENGALDHNPTVNLHPAHFEREEADELATDIDELARVDLECADFEWTDSAARDRAAVFMFLHAGLQVAEAHGLDWSDVDVQRARLTIRRRSGVERVVPLPPLLHRALSALQAEGDGSGAVFRRARNGDRLSTRSLLRVVADAGENVGIQGLTPKVLRSAFVWELARQGTPTRKIAELAGYSCTNAVLTKLGALGPTTATCKDCNGRPNLGAVASRCRTCWGTGIEVLATAAYLRRMEPVNVAGRLKAWSSEMRATASLLHRAPPKNSEAANQFEDIGRDLLGIANTLVGGGELPRVPRIERHRARPRLVMTERMRALGTEMRKLGDALVALGMIRVADGRLLQAMGANSWLIAWGIEEDASAVPLWSLV
jgi:site-specific recombinase XerD